MAVVGAEGVERLTGAGAVPAPRRFDPDMAAGAGSAGATVLPFVLLEFSHEATAAAAKRRSKLFLRGVRLGLAGGGPCRGGGLVRTTSRARRPGAFRLPDRSDGGVHFKPEQRPDVIVRKDALAFDGLLAPTAARR